jgi:hypothetical protein
MEQLTTLTFKDTKYCSVDELIKLTPKYARGAINSRDLMKKKKITDFIYLRKNAKTNKWSLSDGSSVKMDKVFMNQSIIATIDELFTNNIALDNTEMAPNLIHLSADEMFRDDEGNILDIETRGIREPSNIYFKVKDVGNKFNIPALQHTLTDNRTDYEINKHYKYFTIKCDDFINTSDRQKLKKEIYLTYLGFRKVISNTRYFSDITRNTSHIWLNQFNDKKMLYQIDIQNDKTQSMCGYVYCITSHLVNSVKIGYWTSNLKSLRSRYITYYGSDLEMFYVETTNACQLEKECHIYFDDCRIDDELFTKKKLTQYKDFLMKHKKDVDTDLFNEIINKQTSNVNLEINLPVN